MKEQLKEKFPAPHKKEKVDTGKIYLEYLKKKNINKKPEKSNGKTKSKDNH